MSLELKPGDLIVATKISHYMHAGAEGKQSQWVGDLIMVNNPRSDGSVGGTGLYDGPGKRQPGERPSLGLGTSLHAGTYRLATPDDPGYVATREQWANIHAVEVKQLRLESFIWGIIAILSLGALAAVVFP